MQQKGQHLNQLLQRLPPGLLIDSNWLLEQGLSRPLIRHYVSRGWLERLMPRVYRRPAGAAAGDPSSATLPPSASPTAAAPIRWELAVVSAQALVEKPFHVGGPTALDLLGFSHFLDLGRKMRVTLYDPGRSAPTWLVKLPLDVKTTINTRRLFLHDDAGLEWRRFELGTGRLGGPVDRPDRVEPWDHFLRIAGPERATIELLEDVGTSVGFNTADNLFEGLSNLRPALLVRLLQQCTSVKAKRLFFFYAERHGHAWAKRVHAHEVDLGRGKRQIVKGGRLHPLYQITVPAEMMPQAAGPDDG